MARALNATAASLLGFLHERPMSGWDLVETAQGVIGGFWSLTRSQVYRELARLAEDGLAEAGEPGSRDRREYTLTDAGRAAFLAWMEVEPGPEQIRYPLLLKVALGRHLSPERLAEFAASHRREHERRLAEYEEFQAAALARERSGEEPRDPYGQATLDFGVRYERAVLEWFAALPPEVAGPAPGQEV